MLILEVLFNFSLEAIDKSLEVFKDFLKKRLKLVLGD